MKSGRNYFIFYSIIAMMISLFFSRAGLSMSTAFFVCACLLHTRIVDQLKSFISSPVLWGMSLLFLLPLISGLWSENKDEWLQNITIKLPLLLMPLSFAYSFNFAAKQWRWLAIIFVLLVTGGTIWGMYYYLIDFRTVHEGYLHARTIVTPLENDHVRFSWLISLSIIILGWLWWQTKKETSAFWLYGILIIYLVIFLHILAARTGLLSFYVSVLFIAARFIIKERKWTLSVGLVAAIVLLPTLAYFLFPTFHNRVKYFLYDFEYFKDANYLPGGNDATRVISIKTGLSIMLEHPMKGTGFGDITENMNRAYVSQHPSMQERDKIKPSSEWVVYGVGTGIPGILLFTFCILTPFFARIKKKWEWWLLSIIVAASFLFDIGLEVQFGVFIYCFAVLSAWKSLNIETERPK